MSDSSGLGAAGQLSGPRARTCSTMLVTSSVNLTPSEALAQVSFSRPGSIPICSKCVLQKCKSTHGFVILIYIMAVARMAAGDHDPIRALRECLQYKGWVNPSRAHHPDQADIGWIFHSSQILLHLMHGNCTSYIQIQLQLVQIVEFVLSCYPHSPATDASLAILASSKPSICARIC